MDSQVCLHQTVQHIKGFPPQLASCSLLISYVLMLLQVSAKDPDWVDHPCLLYTMRGDGIDGHLPADVFFRVNSLTDEIKG